MVVPSSASFALFLLSCTRISKNPLYVFAIAAAYILFLEMNAARSEIVVVIIKSTPTTFTKKSEIFELIVHLKVIIL